MARDCGLRPGEFWELSWYDCTKYMSISRDHQESENQKQQIEWVRTRKLWLPLQTATFKKEGGGEWKETDLIEFDFDKPKEEPVKLSFKEAKALLGSKIKKADGGK